MREVEKLDGDWHFKTGEDQGSFTYFDFDDSSWSTIRVPSHWHNEGYPYYADEAWYRLRFPTPPHESNEQLLLRFSAVDYFATVWLNGIRLGEHEGYFAPFTFPISPDLLAQGENVLVVQVKNPADVKDLVKGALLRWDCNDRKANPGGIWESVTMLAASPTEFVRLHADTSLVRDDLAILHLSARITHCGGEQSARLRIILKPQNFDGAIFEFEKRVGLFPGEQEIYFDFELPGARLWWPADWGHPSLYEVTLELRSTANDLLTSVKQTCGLREITRGDRWGFYINGRKFFVRGVNYLSDQFMSIMSVERYQHDLDLARNAYVNTFQLFGNVERSDFYRLCDERGILVMQYLSIQYDYHVNDSLVERASQVLGEMIHLLDPHPSIVAWVMNGEANQETHVHLDRQLAEHCRVLDHSRIVQVSSFPVMPQNLINEDMSMHDWMTKFCHYSGVIGRDSGQTGAHSLVAEFGHQSLPNMDMLRELNLDSVYPPDWNTIKAHNGWRDELCQYESENLEAVSDLDGLIHHTQQYQGELIRYYIDHFRCHRFSRCNGLILFHFVDCWRAVTWSVLDYHRLPKEGYGYLREAFAPVNFVADCPPVLCLGGETIEIPLYAVNDTIIDQSDYTGEVVLRDSSDTILFQSNYSFAIPPDSAFYVDTLHWQVPSLEADYRLTLILCDSQGAKTVRRTYRIMARPSYLLPLADPKIMRTFWSWYRPASAAETLTFEKEDDLTFARFHSPGDQGMQLLNRVPLRNVAVGERLTLSVRARATGDSQTQEATCQIHVGFRVTDLSEADPYGEILWQERAGTGCVLNLPVTGAWHELRDMVTVPVCPPGKELHFECWCGVHGKAVIDVTDFQLIRGTP